MQETETVIAAVKRALEEAGIEIPFPYRTLTFKEELGLRSKESLQHADRESRED